MSQHYHGGRQNVGVDRLSRAVDRVAGSKLFSKVGPAVIPRLDRAIYKLSGGRVLLAEGRLPALMLTTTGRKTGERRQTPLACLVDDDGSFVVVGSNFGRASHPAWTANLLADPRAAVGHHGKVVDVTARLLDEDERAALWDRMVEVFPNFDAYEDRSGRHLRVFRLTPI